MKEEERIGKLKASLESLIEDYLGKDINNYKKLGVKEFIELVMETIMKSERKVFLSKEEDCMSSLHYEYINRGSLVGR
ncbi:MAG: hypothetical protein RXR65_02295 [Hydrogenobaculum sp.]